VPATVRWSQRNLALGSKGGRQAGHAGSALSLMGFPQFGGIGVDGRSSASLCDA
jgi:hypothetical protein